MRSDLLSEILDLSITERIQLIQDVWDSIAAEPEELPLTDEERQEMDRRLADVEANPGVGRPWAEVKTRLLGSV
ncbi:MAG TPA: addiction module protein [Longimicrobiaceae bacterium]|jgi:putative addiction module component (TIGR02574 family)|nr:addiction module protein [Longimicrobiaceae bacterium]